MKKGFLLAAALLVIISALFIITFINKKNSKNDNEESLNTSITDIPDAAEPSGEITVGPSVEITVEPSEEVESEFTEGIRIKKYPDNYACFRFETPQGFQIVCDPYNIYEAIQPDIVIESHSDSDHADTSNLEQPYELITAPGEYAIGDAVIKGYSGKHNTGSKEGTNNIFVITVNGITIAHFASQGELPKDEVLDQIGVVDILLIQAFDNPTYNKLVFGNVYTIIDKLKPKIVIPEHGSGSAGSFLAKHYDVKEELIDTGNIIITRSILDETTELRVINLDNNNYE